MNVLKYILATLIFFISSITLVQARDHFYECGTVYMSTLNKKGWSDYQPTILQYDVLISYPRMVLTDQDNDRYYYTFSSYKKTFYTRDNKKYHQVIMNGLNSSTGDKVTVNLYEYDAYWDLLEIIESTGIKVLFKVHEIEKEQIIMFGYIFLPFFRLKQFNTLISIV